MPIIALLIAIEGFFSRVVFSPNEMTDMSVVSLCFFAFNTLVLALVIIMSVKNENVSLALLVTLIGRVAVAVWDTYAQGIFILPNAEGDAIAYRQVAMSFAFGGRAGMVDLQHYAFYLGQFYKLFGRQDLVAKFINIYLAICGLVLIYRILVAFSVRRKTIENTMLLGCLLPNSWIVCTTTLQESIIAFCVIASIYMYTKWWFSRRIGYLFIAAAASLFGGMLHVGGLVPLLGFAVMTPFIRKSSKKLSINSTSIVFSVVLGVALLGFIALFGGTFLRKIGGSLSISSMTSKSGGWGGVGSGDYSAGIAGLSGMAGLLVNSPLKALNFVFAPMPWRWRGPGDIMAFTLSASFYIYTLYVAVKAFRSRNTLVKNDQTWSFNVVLFVIMALASLMFGWGVSNAGTAMRHREKFTYVCLLIVAFSKEIMFRRRQNGAKDLCHHSDLQGRVIS